MVLILQSGPAYAEQDPLRITIGYLPETEQTSQTTTVIEREEIVRFGPAAVVDIFRQLPGVHVEQAGSS